MAKKTEKIPTKIPEKKFEKLDDNYDLGLSSLKDFYILINASAYLSQKFKIGIVELYKKIIPNYTDYELKYYKRIEQVILNISDIRKYEKEVDTIGLNEKQMIAEIKRILMNLLPF